jgi:hypothetical protein
MNFPDLRRPAGHSADILDVPSEHELPGEFKLDLPSVSRDLADRLTPSAINLVET